MIAVWDRSHPTVMGKSNPRIEVLWMKGIDTGLELFEEEL
jgi:hypothetical protein